MSIQVLFNHNRESKVFHSGDQITGTVTAVGPIREQDTTVTIQFKGKSVTMIRVSRGESMQYYRDKAKFFSISKVLFRGPCHLPANASISWPFQFQLPMTTESERSNQEIQPTAESFTAFARRAHDLPPPVSVDGWIGRKKAQAYITYTLTATATRSAFLSRTLEANLNLPVRRRRIQSANGTPSPQMTSAKCWFEHASLKLKSPELAQQHRKVGEWFGDKFTSNAPSAAFSLVACTPKVLITDQGPISVQLTLRHDSTKSTASVVPDVKLTSLEYRLKQYTQVRALSGWGREEKVELSGFAVIRRLTFGNSSASLLMSGETVDLGVSAGLSLKGSAVVPTFETYNIRRYYAVTLYVTVDVVGKQIMEKFKWKPVLVLPENELLLDGSSTARIEPQQDFDIGLAGEEPVPTYENGSTGGEPAPTYERVAHDSVAPNEKADLGPQSMFETPGCVIASIDHGN